MTCTLPGQQMPVPWPLTPHTLAKAGRFVVPVIHVIHLIVIVTVTITDTVIVVVIAGMSVKNVCWLKSGSELSAYGQWVMGSDVLLRVSRVLRLNDST